MTESFDVVVVGAGIVGAAIAAEAALNGSVLLLETENDIGLHASGRSAAVLLQTYGPVELQELTALSRPIIEGELSERTGAPLLTPRPVLWSGLRTDSLLPVVQEAASNPFAPEVEWLDGTAAAALHPGLDPAQVEIACLEPGAAAIDVERMHRALLALARDRTAELRRGTGLQSARRDGAGWSIALADGTVRAGTVVNAAGAWGDRVAVACGVLPIGLSPRTRTVLVATCDRPATDDLPFVADLRDDLYFKPMGSQFLISPADEKPSEPGQVRPDELDVALAIERLHERTRLRVRRVTSTWAGQRTFAPDRLPVLGPDPEQPGFLWAAGSGGFGIMTSPALARVVGSWLRDETPNALARRLTRDRLHAPALS